MSSVRFKSIDILRALTMLLMIFVNDLWTLTAPVGWATKQHRKIAWD